MEQQFTAYTGLSLEEVQQRFERWRKGRKRGTPIPTALWEGAVRLCVDHSLYKISSALHLDYNVLKKRFQSAGPDPFPESVTPSDFVALDLRSSLPEFIMEMERAGGRMRIHPRANFCNDHKPLADTFFEGEIIRIPMIRCQERNNR